MIFQGIGTSIAKKPYAFVIFQKGSGPPFPPLDPPMLCFYATLYEGCISVDFHYLFRMLGYLFFCLKHDFNQESALYINHYLRGSRGAAGNTDLDPLKNHKSCQASIQCLAIIGTPYGVSLATDNDQLIVVFGSSQKL